jgi:hypothetical protein
VFLDPAAHEFGTRERERLPIRPLRTPARSKRPGSLTPRREAKNFPTRPTAAETARRARPRNGPKVLNGNAFLSNGSATSSTRWNFTILCRRHTRQAACDAACRDRTAANPLDLDENRRGISGWAAKSRRRSVKHLTTARDHRRCDSFDPARLRPPAPRIPLFAGRGPPRWGRSAARALLRPPPGQLTDPGQGCYLDAPVDVGRLLPCAICFGGTGREEDISAPS